LGSDDELEYVDQVRDRAGKLARTGIWDPIDPGRLCAWLGCLDNYGAGLLGAYLLDNLCCRSRLQFLALLDSLFLDLRKEDYGFRPTGRLVDALRDPPPKSPRLIFAPVIGHSAPPTKSGPYVLRLCQRRYRLHSDWLSWPFNLEQFQDLDHLFLVDDFCGTGEQFDGFAKSIDLGGLRRKRPNLRVVYLVASAHENGIGKIVADWPFVEVRCGDRLVATNGVLSDACFERYEIPGFKDRVLAQYHEVVSKAGLPRSGKLAMGFGDLGLAYAFAHATPNNTLPIFWYETPRWTPLLDR
jgi:hypothetical protein